MMTLGLTLRYSLGSKRPKGSGGLVVDGTVGTYEMQGNTIKMAGGSGIQTQLHKET